MNRIFFLLPGLILVLGCVTTKNEGLILKSRIDSLEKKFKQRETEFPGVREVTAANQKELARISRQQADLLNQLGEIRQSIMALGGRLEEGQNFFLRMDDLEDRLQAQAERITALEEVISPANGEIDAQKLELKWENEEAGYRDAYASYESGQYPLARAKFEKLLELYPQGQFADNARYWIGECFYALRDFERAILNFNQVLERYPKSGKIPNAYLKLGLAFLEIGKSKEAKISWETLVARFPGSEPARIAREKIKKLK